MMSRISTCVLTVCFFLSAVYAAAGPSLTKVRISFTTPAYAGLPVWLTADTPNPLKIHYPSSTVPSDFGCSTVEVQHEGRKLIPVIRPNPAARVGPPCGFVSLPGSPESRLPLHLQHPSMSAGTYRVRYTRYEYVHADNSVKKVTTEQSDWTPLVVLAAAQTERDRWAEETLAQLPGEPGLLAGDALPSLLAVPNRAVLRVFLELMYGTNDVVSGYARESLPMFDPVHVRDESLSLMKRKGPCETQAQVFNTHGEIVAPIAEPIVDVALPYLKSADQAQVRSAVQLLQSIRNPYYHLSSAEVQEVDAALVDSVAHIIRQKNDYAAHFLAPYFGFVRPQGARDRLWQLVRSRLGYEQVLICITWLRNPRDLPQLAAEVEKEDASDQYGREHSSLAYHLVRGYGAESARPYLRRFVTPPHKPFVRTSSAQELIRMNDAAGFQFFIATLRQRPFYRQEMLTFLKNTFPELQKADEGTMLAFLDQRMNAALKH